jgi:hypothetical protein
MEVTMDRGMRVVRGAAVSELIRRLQQRPVARRPGWVEVAREALERVDTPGHSAELSDDQFTSFGRSEPVLWRSVLCFITRSGDSPVVRAFWVDPRRLSAFGARLEGDESHLVAAILDRSTAPEPAASVRLDLDLVGTSLSEYRGRDRFVLEDGTPGERDMAAYAPPDRVAVVLHAGSAREVRVELRAGVPAAPALEWTAIRLIRRRLRRRRGDEAH